MSISNASEVASVSTGSSFMALLPMVVIFAIFYFFLIRPQLKRQRELEKTISGIKKGDKVVAAGGIYGIVSKIDDNIVSLEIAENTLIKVAKSSITEVMQNSNNSAKEVNGEIKVKSAKTKTKKTEIK